MAYNLPPIESLVAVLTAARTRSFSAAALELDTTHAAISRRVSAAEAWSGVRLFERHARGVETTPAGQRVLARLETALQQLQQLAAGRTARSELPVVRVATTPSLARFWLFPRLRALQGDPADTRVEVVADLTHADLAGGEVDLAIRYGRGGWAAGHEHPLLRERLIPAYLPALGAPPRGQELQWLLRQPLLHAGDMTLWRAWAAHHGAVLKSRTVDRVLGDYALTIDAALAGMGVALWNPALHAPDARLRFAERLGATPVLRYYLLARAADVRSPAAQVARRLKALARETPARPA